ncbi:MAG: hypothetical protein D6706_09275 [Chloroflexi bacterium]|nr:MAG: hypothetical protein D6706_09275 [Chloroflexota bacterium]
MSQPFVLGVNYWPRRKAMYWWSQFDATEVQEEFAIIRDLGLTLVRIFLLWEDWQPAPDTVSPRAMENLATVCDIAAAYGLGLDVTFFTGHMSGPNWIPAWMLDEKRPFPPHVRQIISQQKPVYCGYRNPFTDPLVLDAAEHLLDTVVANFHTHPAIAMWNLGNEPDLVAIPPNPATGRAWTRRMVNRIRTHDPHHPITFGLHVDSLVTDNHLRVHDIFAEVDTAVMHGYPMYADWATSPLDPDFVPYLCALTTALSGKPTLMEEFGGCTNTPGQPSHTWHWHNYYGRSHQQFMAAEEDLADYLTQVLPRLVNVGALGAVLWCFADYTPTLHHRPPCDQSRHERHFGLVRPDGTLKPHASRLRQFAASNPVVQPARHQITLDITPEEYYAAPLTHARRLYQQFRQQL